MDTRACEKGGPNPHFSQGFHGTEQAPGGLGCITLPEDYMRSFLAPVLALALTASGALAADNGPLPAGKPAGVQQANLAGHGLFLLVGAGLIAAGIAIAVSNGNSNNPSTSTTGTAP
jgi:hypothetical protein